MACHPPPPYVTAPAVLYELFPQPLLTPFLSSHLQVFNLAYDSTSHILYGTKVTSGQSQKSFVHIVFFYLAVISLAVFYIFGFCCSYVLFFVLFCLPGFHYFW